MRQLPSRLRRLDDALYNLPFDDGMLLSELDGFLTGIAVCPDAIPPVEWLPFVWRAEEGGVPFDDPLDAQWFADSVVARRDEIVRDLSRDKLRPIFDTDDRSGELLWDIWIDGFAAAMVLRPDAWQLLGRIDADARAALEGLATLVAIAFDESTLDSMEINAIEATAPVVLTQSVQRLHAARLRSGSMPGAATVAPSSAKAGRNDPCPCGSGQKFKRCCG